MRVRSLKCPSCGGRARLEHGEAEAACVQCGEPVRLSQAILEEQNRARSFPAQTPLKLGMKATFSGKEFEATGRQVMRESDDEGVSTWEEWVLIAADGDLVYLEFDEGKWKFTRPFVPETPLGPDVLSKFSAGTALPIDNHGALVSSSGRYQLAHAEGEFPYVVVPGRVVGYVDAARGGEVFAVEWTDDAVEYYRGRFLDERQVYTMFGLHQLVQQVDRRAQVLRSRKLFGGVCVGMSLLALCFWLYSFAGGTVAAQGQGTVDLSTAGQEGVRFGPIPLRAADRVHRLEITGSMREQSSWVQAILEDENEQEILSAERDMWDESGHDSDGAWHESDLHSSADFVLKKPGNYYVRIYAEPEPGRAPAQGSRATFVLKERVLFPLYLGIYGFVGLLLGLVFLVVGSPGTIQKLKDSAESD